ncbi:MAG: baseplate J/gp47 family protein [Janthinobacterium lividum]
MALNLKDFGTIVSDQVTAIQAASKSLIDTTIGSIIRALTESNAAVVLWIQSLIITLLATTRASTSTGTDLDTWMADYSVTRLPSVPATGNVTFARFTATNPATVPVGARVQTGDGSQVFQVIEDTTNPAYAVGGYTLGAGVASLAVKVQAVTAGSANNVVIGGINTLATAISGIDTVTNPAAFANGADAESDTALRLRFVAYVASLSKATRDAVGYAISSLQTGLKYSFVENQSYPGATDYGYFYVVVDDGTGTPGSTLLTSVANAIDRVRPVTSRFGVFAPVVLLASLSMTTTIAAGYDAAATRLAVQNALTNYVNTLGLGQALVYTRLFQLAYNVPGVSAVNSLQVNGSTADITVTPKQAVKASVVSVS